jgi:hypothetical protein
LLRIRSFVALSLVAVATAACSQEPVTLRYNPTPGRLYHYSAEFSIGSSGPVSVGMKILMVLGMRINEVTDQSIKLQQTVEYIRAASKQPGSNQDRMVAQAKKVKIQAVVDRQGNGVSTTAGGNGSMSAFAGMLNGFASSAIGIVLPKDPVKVGSTWTYNVDLAKMLGAQAQQMKFKAEKPLTVTYVLKGFAEQSGRKVALVDWTLQGNLLMDMSGMAGGGGAANIQPRLSFDGSGHASVDLPTGLNLTSQMDISIAITVTGLPAGSEQNAGQTQKLSAKMSLVAPNQILTTESLSR